MEVHRCGKDQGVDPVQHTAVAFKQGAPVLDAPVAFDGRHDQAAKEAHEANQQRHQGRSSVPPFRSTLPAICAAVSKENAAPVCPCALQERALGLGLNAVDGPRPENFRGDSNAVPGEVRAQDFLRPPRQGDHGAMGVAVAAPPRFAQHQTQVAETVRAVYTQFGLDFLLPRCAIALDDKEHSAQLLDQMSCGVVMGFDGRHVAQKKSLLERVDGCGSTRASP